MKIGMMFESGPQGAEKSVCEHLARIIRPEIEISSATHRNKPELISDCGKDVVNLLKEGCKRIFIIWDLFPAWRKKGEKPCRREDRQAIFQSLKQAGVQKAPVILICIREELEAWLMADGRALSRMLSTAAHPATAKGEKDPDRVSNPKGRLKKIFQTNGRGPYNDLVHAIKIIRELPDLNQLRRSESFRRFEEKLK